MGLKLERLITILKENLNIKKNDIVFIHSSVDNLNLDFPFYKIINIILEIVGENGTILFPSSQSY